MYRELDSRLITATARRLAERIGERFPDSGLGQVSQEVCALSEGSEQRAARLRRSDWRIRAAVTAGLLLIVSVAVSTVVLSIRQFTLASSVADFFQGLDAAINDVIFLGLGVFFLVTLESRLKRRVALRELDELRSIAHIIDMHQLTKDPEHVMAAVSTAPSSPADELTRGDLARYLDYCSELLSITSKLAALYVQSLKDPVVLESVNGIQALTIGLSGKIWQKIVILDTIAPLRQPDR